MDKLRAKHGPAGGVKTYETRSNKNATYQTTEKGGCEDLVKPIYNELRRKMMRLSGTYGDKQIYLATGLKNYGNICYMNAVLQCLVRSEEILKMIMSRDNETLMSQKRTVVGELSFLAKIMKSGEYKSVLPIDFKTEVQKTMKQFAGTRQQDAHELLTFLLDQIKEEIKEENNQTQICYQGKYESTISCMSCGDVHLPKTEEFNSIQVNIQDKEIPNIEDAVNEEKETEKIQCYCEKCGENNPSHKTMKIKELPEMLIVQIRRFDLVRHGLYIKNPKEVPIPHTLKVDNGESGRNQYELVSFINHTGTTEGGHYTACCKDSVGESWYLFDDSKVEQITRLDKREKGAYILFYKRNVMMQMEKDGSTVLQSGKEIFGQGENKAPENDANVIEVRRSNRESKPSEKAKAAATYEKTTAISTQDGHLKEPTRQDLKSKRKDSEASESIIDEERFCLCNKPDDHRKYMRCEQCSKWYHPDCIQFQCKECNNAKVKDMEENIQQLMKLMKSKDAIIHDVESKIKAKDKECERLRKESGRYQNELEKKDAKYRKELESTKEKMNLSEKEHSRKQMEQDEKHDQEKDKLIKELENKKREIDIHVKKIIELTEENRGKKLEKEADEENEADATPTKKNLESIVEYQETQENCETEKEKEIAELREKLNEVEKIRKAEEEKWRGEKKAMEKIHLEEVTKLKDEIKDYDARLEGILEDGSRKEKMMDALLEDNQLTKKVNQTLEMQMGKECNNNKGEETGERKSNSKRKCWRWLSKGTCKFEDECWFEHPVTGDKKEKRYTPQEKHTVPGRRKENCRHWARNGECPYGERCWFEHPEIEKDSKKQWLRSRRETRAGIPYARFGGKNRMCRYVTEGHECPYGNGCHFDHGQGKKQIEEKEKKSQIPYKQSPKNPKEGMQEMERLHSLYSLMNHVKNQDMEINILKKMMSRLS